MTKPEAIKLVEKEVEKFYQIAEKKHGKTFPRPKVIVKNMGANIAGQIYVNMFNSSKIELNEFFLLHPKTFKDMMEDTIPHEIAHDITEKLYKRKLEAHGREWQNIMTGTFSLNPNRCHDYARKIGDLRDAMSGKVFIYKCPCCGKEFPKTTYIHNCITQGKKWFWHPACGNENTSRLKFAYQYK